MFLIRLPLDISSQHLNLDIDELLQTASTNVKSCRRDNSFDGESCEFISRESWQSMKFVHWHGLLVNVLYSSWQSISWQSTKCSYSFWTPCTSFKTKLRSIKITIYRFNLNLYCPYYYIYIYIYIYWQGLAKHCTNIKTLVCNSHHVTSSLSFVIRQKTCHFNLENSCSFRFGFLFCE